MGRDQALIRLVLRRRRAALETGRPQPSVAPRPPTERRLRFLSAPIFLSFGAIRTIRKSSLYELTGTVDIDLGISDSGFLDFKRRHATADSVPPPGGNHRTPVGLAGGGSFQRGETMRWKAVFIGLAL